MPPGLKLALGPILTQIAEMTLKIKQYGRNIQRMTQTEYAETQPMMSIHGVGHGKQQKPQRQQQKQKTPIRKNIDISDLLIQNAVTGWDGRGGPVSGVARGTNW